jgi:hypothetical protein
MTLPPAPDRWTIDLANAERMEAIAAFGFTERQARFLLNVLLHSGVFVERQYCSFAGIVHGQKSTDFIKTLVERRFATPITTGKLHRGRMFHVHYKPLWAAIGQPDNRFRKPAAQHRQEALWRRAALRDHCDDDCRVPARPSRCRQGESHDQHGRGRVVSGAEVLRPMAIARGPREELA